MRYIWVVFLLPSVVWADYQRTPSAGMDISALSSELDAACGGQLSICDDTNGTITCRRKTGDFSPAEVAAMDAAVAAHDPNVKATRATQQRTSQATGKAKLKALGLTQAELDALGLP